MRKLQQEKSKVTGHIRTRETKLRRNDEVRAKLQKIDEKIAAMRKEMKDLETTGRLEIFKQADPKLAELYKRREILTRDATETVSKLMRIRMKLQSDLRQQQSSITREISKREKALSSNQELQKKLAEIDSSIRKLHEKRVETLKNGKLKLYEQIAPELAALLKDQEELTARISEVRKDDKPDPTELRKLFAKRRQLHKEINSKERELRKNKAAAEQMSEVQTQARQLDAQTRQLRQEKAEAMKNADPELTKLREQREEIYRKLRELSANARGLPSRRAYRRKGKADKSPKRSRRLPAPPAVPQSTAPEK